MESTSFNAAAAARALVLDNGLADQTPTATTMTAAAKQEQQKSPHEPFINAFFRQLSPTMDLFADKHKGQILKLVKHDWLYSVWGDWLGFVDFYMASNPKFVAASVADNEKTIENFVKTTKKFLDSVFRSPKTKNYAACWTYPLWNLDVDLTGKKTIDFASLSSILIVDDADKFISDVQARIGEQLPPFRFVQRSLFNRECVLVVAADRTHDGDGFEFVTRTFVIRILPAVLRGEVAALGPINNNVVDKYEDCIRRVVAFYVEAKAKNDGAVDGASPSSTTTTGHGYSKRSATSTKRNKSKRSSTEENETQTTTIVEQRDSDQATKLIRCAPTDGATFLSNNDPPTDASAASEPPAKNAAPTPSKQPPKRRSRSKKRVAPSNDETLDENDDADEPPEKRVCAIETTTTPVCLMPTMLSVPPAQMPPLMAFI